MCSAKLGWEVHLPASLSDETDAQQQAWDARHLSLHRAHIPETAPGKIDVRELGQGLPRPRPGYVDRSERGCDVNDVGAIGGPRIPPVEPFLYDIGVAGSGGHEVSVFSQARDRTVIEDGHRCRRSSAHSVFGPPPDQRTGVCTGGPEVAVHRVPRPPACPGFRHR